MVNFLPTIGIGARQIWHIPTLNKTVIICELTRCGENYRHINLFTLLCASARLSPQTLYGSTRPHPPLLLTTLGYSPDHNWNGTQGNVLDRMLTTAQSNVKQMKIHLLMEW